MLSKCANPACRTAFDYREGRFFRFHKADGPNGTRANTHSVQHFWLCGKCTEEFTLMYEAERGVLLKERFEPAVSSGICRFVAAA
jgi:hypothetical protein